MTYKDFLNKCDGIIKRRTDGQDEENTKHKLVIPFLELLGYGTDDLVFERLVADCRHILNGKSGNPDR